MNEAGSSTTTPPARTDAQRARPADRLAGDGPLAAWTVAADGTVVGWDEGAVRLFDVTADQALGRPCHELVCGRDLFGNRFCSRRCAIRAQRDRELAVNDYVLRLTGPGGELRLTVSVRCQPDPLTGEVLLVHVAVAHPA